jgi:hypothetical protein
VVVVVLVALALRKSSRRLRDFQKIERGILANHRLDSRGSSSNVDPSMSLAQRLTSQT